MHLVEGQLLLSPTDLVSFLACDHLTQRELAASRGDAVRPERVDPNLELLARRGYAHEEDQLGLLRGRGQTVVEIDDHGETLAGLRAAEAETLAAMRAGADVVYQATFFDGRWRGRADFLIRVDTPSTLGAWSYEVADAKLARSVKVGALLQMCEYSRQVTRLQGTAPARMHVLLGTGTQESHRVADYDAYFRAARRRFEDVIDGGPVATYPDPVDHCSTCSWLPECEQRRRSDDHLSLVAGIRRDQVTRLEDVGITTMETLAATAPAPHKRIGDAALARLHHQARLQVREREHGVPCHELVDCTDAGRGLGALPPPSTADLFFDMEGDPYFDTDGLEYLFGVTEVIAADPVFRGLWGHDRGAEKQAFEQLVDFIVQRWEADPSLHVYHYASYETTALKKLMSRHGTREDEVDRLLRAGVFVDLYQVVHQGVRASRESYSLKKLEVFYMGSRTEEIADAMGSVVAYERWRESHDQSILDDIEAYNRRDCESTWRLRGWLEELRTEWAAAHGSELPRPPTRTGDAPESVAAATAASAALFEALTEDLPADTAPWTAADAARRLLADLLDWHRREAKATWWAFYERCTKTDAELVDDKDALGAIEHLGMQRTEKRSEVHRYGFDPAQEHKMNEGAKPCDPRTGKGCGTVVAGDDSEGWIELKRGIAKTDAAEVAHPTSLIPGGPVSTDEQQAALLRVAQWTADHGLDAPGRYRAARDLLLRRTPRLVGTAAAASLLEGGEDPATGAVRIAAALDGSYLAIQGPPGAGKTYTAGHIVVDAVRRGLTVGITATTHHAIGEVLNETCKAATAAGVTLRILQKCDDGQQCPHPSVRRTGANGDVEKELAAGTVDVVAGTAWLFSREKLDGQLGILLVDEAGQMSLANAVAVSCAAGNLVLLGDPQQLSQPSQGIHPRGSDTSALAHVLGGAETIDAAAGIFLATTRRMHPDVCTYISTSFYDGRLFPDEDCSRQRLNGDGPLGGTGLRYVGVPHRANRTWSPEEAVAVRRVVDELLLRSWTARDGVSQPLTLDEILVVAPYTLQVRRLREVLPAGARVGTVDKFQGQEAAVTIYAMATSSSEDVPRNLEFLFSGNRLNVAVSRAQAMSILVCSPQLLRAGCRTPDQLRLVNALCRFEEMAVPLEVDRSAGEPAAV